MKSRVLGVLAGRDLPTHIVKIWAENCDLLIAADSGADHLLEIGLVPHVIIGDMDSLVADPLLLSSEIIKIDDQNLSDCDKLLDWVHEQGHANVVLAGAEGDRLDHLLGSLGSLLRAKVAVRLAIRDGVADLLRPGKHLLSARPGSRISLMPLVPSAGVSISGVEWPLSDVTLELGGQVSLSNVAVADEVIVSLQTGAVLAFRSLEPGQIPLWPGENSV